MVEGVPIQVNTENGKEKSFITLAEFKSYDIFVDFLETSTFEVVPETIGQYTGLTDKNGVKIFEGDICVVKRIGTLAYGFITFRQGCFVFEEEKTKNLLRLCDAKVNGYQIEVRGNLHDDPELMRGD